MSPVVHLTPGRCSQCGRFVAKDTAPDVWAVEVGEDYQQVPGEPNIFARTRCRECVYVVGQSWAWNVDLLDALVRARQLGEAS